MWQFINYQNDGWFQLKHVDTGMYLTMQDEGNLTIEAGNPLTSLPNSNRSKYFFSLPHIFGMSSYRRCSRKKKLTMKKKVFSKKMQVAKQILKKMLTNYRHPISTLQAKTLFVFSQALAIKSNRKMSIASIYFRI